MTTKTRRRTDAEPTPAEWLADLGQPPVELDSPYDLVTNEADRATIDDRRRRRASAHHLAEAIREARRQAVGTQIAAAAAWGRAQSQVSRLESDPSVVQLGTLIDYLSALDVEITIGFCSRRGRDVAVPPVDAEL
jgi:hypothetical protein